MKNGGVDYKKKYYSLRQRFVSTLSVSFRSGYEQGYNAALMAQPQGMPQQPGQEGGEPGQATGAPGQAAQPDEGESQPQEDELDQSIAELESLIAKTENSGNLKKSLDHLKTKRVKAKEAKMFKSMAKQTASNGWKNLSHTQRQAVTLQEKIVKNVLTKWEQEENKTTDAITRLLGTEALTK